MSRGPQGSKKDKLERLKNGINLVGFYMSFAIDFCDILALFILAIYNLSL
jgi:hypothetical protein